MPKREESRAVDFAPTPLALGKIAGSLQLLKINLINTPKRGLSYGKIGQ
jgi:hypothetical protein